MRRMQIGTVLVLALLTAATFLQAADRKDSVPPLERADYEKALLQMVAGFESGQTSEVLQKHKALFAMPVESVPKDKIAEQRNWTGKKLLDCDLAAIKVVTPTLHLVYVLAVTDRDPCLWEFRVYRPKKSEKFQIFALKYNADLSVLGGEMTILLRPQPPVTPSESETPKDAPKPAAPDPAAGAPEAKK